MTILRTDLGDTRERARELRFEPSGSITETNVQTAIEQAALLPEQISATAVNAAASPYTVQSTDTYLYVDSSGGAVQILLSAASLRSGVPLVIKDIGGAASDPAKNITITPSGAETIDGLAPLVINAAYGGYKLNPRSGVGYTVSP